MRHSDSSPARGAPAGPARGVHPSKGSLRCQNVFPPNFHWIFEFVRSAWWKRSGSIMDDRLCSFKICMRSLIAFSIFKFGALVVWVTIVIYLSCWIRISWYTWILSILLIVRLRAVMLDHFAYFIGINRFRTMMIWMFWLNVVVDYNRSIASFYYSFEFIYLNVFYIESSALIWSIILVSVVLSSSPIQWPRLGPVILVAKIGNINDLLVSLSFFVSPCHVFG